jgi:hypothetical protein
MRAVRAPEREEDEPMALTWTIGRVAAVTFVVGMVVFWAWIFAGGPGKPNPDHLEDKAFVKQTEQRCVDLDKRIKKLPNPASITTPGQRAAVLDRATDEIEAMVDAIAADSPKTGADAKPIEGWVKDWRRYIADRRKFAHAMRSNPNARFTVSRSALQTSGGAVAPPVDEAIEVFATEANDMPDCGPPGDLG